MPELVHPSQLDPRLADLQRPHHTGFTAGLCRALAQRWRVDPIIVRLVAVALTFAGGIGVALYAWGWLLTPRVGGQPPILRRLPAFGRWPRNTQAIVVAASCVVLVLSVARQTSVAWGPVIVVAALAWALARKRRGATEATASAPDGTSLTTAPPPSPAAGETVEQWRTRLAPHTGSPLPVVDLYAPEPTPHPTAVLDDRTPHPTSWWAALVVLALTALAAAVPLALGLSPALLWACIAASITAAISLLVWALVARSRRMPGALLVLALVGAMGSGLLATTQSQSVDLPLDTSAGGTATYSFVGEANAQLDLTQLPSTKAATVTIDATASVVKVRLAEAPGSVTVLGDTTHVEGEGYRSPSAASQLDLVIDGDFSVVELQVEP